MRALRLPVLGNSGDHHKTRTPLSSWFWAIYRMSHDKKGISAVQLAKEIGVSYPTAWLMLHKIRKAMSDRDRHYRLSGLVEVDVRAMWVVRSMARGGAGAAHAACGPKSVVAVAVEHRGPGKPGKKPVPGFAALEVIPDAATETLEQFLADKVKPRSHILSDGWHGYRRLKQKGIEHTATAISKQNESAHKLFPWVHITLSNLKRFLLGTHHKVEQKHLKHYVAEFNYRLNRRTMEPDLMVRLLRACICAQTITYKQLVAMPELA